MEGPDEMLTGGGIDPSTEDVPYFDSNFDDSAFAEEAFEEESGVVDGYTAYAFIAFILLFVAAFIVQRYIIKPIREKRKSRTEEEKRQQMRAQREKQLNRLEQEGQKFKDSQGYQDIQKALEEREQGILPEHRRTVNRFEDGTNSPFTNRALSAGTTAYRPNINDRYRHMKRGGG